MEPYNDFISFCSNCGALIDSGTFLPKLFCVHCRSITPKSELPIREWMSPAQSGPEPDFLFEVEVTSDSDQTRIAEIAPRIILINDNIIRNLQRFPHEIYTLDPRKFEEIVANLLADQGCDVELTQMTRDGGKDIIATIDTPIGRVLTLVEAKRFSPNRPIAVGLIRQLYGVLYDHPASHAMLVTTSYFSRDSIDFQKRHKYELTLKEFNDVRFWIESYKKDPPKK